MLRAALLFAIAVSAHAQEPVKVYAAGSLRAVMTELGEAWAKAGGTGIAPTFGASGLLRDRLVGGEKADVFASANMEHPQSLAASGRAGPVSLFARNQLCALSTPQARVTSDTLLERMLDLGVKLGTSTPKADPSGDYAFALFDKAEALKPGAQKILATKALQLTGGPGSPPPPADRNVYGALVASGQADVFLTYCTNAFVARKEQPSLAVTTIPSALAVGADYGIATLANASESGAKFVAFVVSSEGRRIIAAHGFAVP